MIDPRLIRTVDAMVAASRKVLNAPHESTKFLLGQHVVELHAPPHVNHAGIRLDQAFLATETKSESDFHIIVIDDSFVGSSPQIDWPAQWHEPFGVVQHRYSRSYRFAIDFHSHSLSMYDPKTRQAVVWFHDVEKIEYWFAATPFRLQLSWFADTFGGEMIHAAGLEFGNSAALMVGPSGSGKSTLTLASMLEGIRMLGDDFLLLTGSDAQAIYRRAKVHDSTRKILGDRLIEIGPVMNADVAGEKRIVDTKPSQMREGLLPVAAVFVPKIAKRAQVSSLSRSDAVRSTLGPTMIGLLGGSAGTLNRISSLVSSVPTFQIDVGPDLEANVHALIDAMSNVTSVGFHSGLQRNLSSP